MNAPTPLVRSDGDVVSFDRRELAVILSLYGRMVAAGEWRDYAMDFTKDAACFHAFRRAAERDGGHGTGTHDSQRSPYPAWEGLS